MYLASKNGKTFRVSGVQVAAFKSAGYTITEEAAKTKAKAKAKAKTAEDADTAEEE